MTPPRPPHTRTAPAVPTTWPTASAVSSVDGSRAPGRPPVINGRSPAQDEIHASNPQSSRSA